MNMKLVERVTEEKESTREKTANTLSESPFLLVSDGTRPRVTSHQMMHKEPAPLYHRPPGGAARKLHGDLTIMEGFLLWTKRAQQAD